MCCYILKMTNELDNFNVSEPMTLWLFPDMLKGASHKAKFVSYKIDKTKEKPWLIWTVQLEKEIEEGKTFRISHYTLYSKGRKIQASEILNKTWILTQDMNNKTKFYMLEDIDSIDKIDIDDSLI